MPGFGATMICVTAWLDAVPIVTVYRKSRSSGSRKSFTSGWVVRLAQDRIVLQS